MESSNSDSPIEPERKKLRKLSSSTESYEEMSDSLKRYKIFIYTNNLSQLSIILKTCNFKY